MHVYTVDGAACHYFDQMANGELIDLIYENVALELVNMSLFTIYGLNKVN